MDENKDITAEDLSKVLSEKEENEDNQNASTSDNAEMRQEEVSDNEQEKQETSTPEKEEKQEGDEEIIKEFTAKVNGKEGTVKWYNDKVVFEVDGHPVREFKSMEELIQKGLGADEKFQQASMLRKQYEQKLKEIEAEKQQIANNMLSVTERLKQGKDEILKVAQEYGIELTEDDIEGLDYGDDTVVGDIIKKIAEKTASKRKDIEQKYVETQRQLLSLQMQEYLNAEPIKQLNEAVPESKIGDLFFAGLSQAIISQAQAGNIEVSPDNLPKIWQATVENVDKALKTVTEKQIPTIIKEKDKAKGILDNIVRMHPDLVKDIKEQAIKEYKDALKKGNEMATPQGGTGGQNTPSQRVLKDYTPEELSKLLSNEEV